MPGNVPHNVGDFEQSLAMPNSAIQNLAEFLRPIRFVVRRLLPGLQGCVARVALLAVAGATLNAVGFLLLLPLLDAIASGDKSTKLGGIALISVPRELSALLLLAIAFVAAGLYLRYRVTYASLEVQKRGTQDAAVAGLGQLRRFKHMTGLRKAVSQVTGRMATACGFVMRQFSMGLADALQLAIFLVAMAWLSPLLTLALLIPAAAILLGFSRSVRGLSNAVAYRPEKNKGLKDEVSVLTHLLKSPDVTDGDIARTLSGWHSEGAHGRSIAGKLDVRREISRAPIIVEALFPLALVPLALVTLGMENWQAHASIIVVFILLLRSVIAIVQRLAGQVMVTGRFQPQIVCFMQLFGNEAPAMLAADEGEDDEDD